MKKIVRVLIVLLVVAAMVVAVGLRRKAMKRTKPYGVRPLAVHVAEVRVELLEKTHRYLGVVEPWQVARISSRVSARVDVVKRREGDRVKKGELLLHLDDGDVRAQIKATQSLIRGLETNYAFWKGENARDMKLAKEGVVSAVAAETTHNRFMEATSKLETARQNLDSLQTQLLYTQLKSPFSGVVISRAVDEGDLAAPGQLLMVVEDRSAWKIAFDAPQEDVAFLKKGMPVRFSAGNKERVLSISRIYPSLNASRMMRVEVKIKKMEGLHSGSFIPLAVLLQQHKKAVTIPRESVMSRSNGKAFVFVVKKKVLQLRPVEIVLESAGRVEVRGVQPGEQVVTSTFLGWANLSDGLKVEVVK